MYYPSKRGLFMGILTWFVFPLIIISLMISNTWIGLIPIVAFQILLIWCWFRTGYSIKENVLIVRTGPLYSKIPIHQIKKVKKAGLVSSFGAALSFNNAIQVFYEYGSEVKISPEDKIGLLKCLKDRNQEIEIEKLLEVE